MVYINISRYFRLLARFGERFDQKLTLRDAIEHDDEVLNKAVELLQKSNGAYFVACGTAHKAAMAAEYYFAEISVRKIHVVPASEMPSFEKFVTEQQDDRKTDSVQSTNK